MFKYPLAVTIDTNIFDAAKFDLCDTSPLKTLENYVKNGKIKVVLSDIVVRESKRHIADQVKKICGIMRKARAAALEESTEHLISTIGLGEISIVPSGIRFMQSRQSSSKRLLTIGKIGEFISIIACVLPYHQIQVCHRLHNSAK